MHRSPLLISLPVADRVRAHAFYRDALGLETLGEPAEDGVPEPLLFVLNADTRLMLVPAGGFGWVVGNHTVASPGTSECVLGLEAATEAEVAETVERARAAGATVFTEPSPQPWGYASAFTDPDGHVWMVTSAPLPS
ncbi:MAG: VOC family protein [Acidimicrobiales bacterium]